MNTLYDGSYVSILQVRKDWKTSQRSLQCMGRCWNHCDVTQFHITRRYSKLQYCYVYLHWGLSMPSQL